jgi:hypothetical protein
MQVAELIGGVVSNFKLSKNKILEAVAETTAPFRPVEDLLTEIPSIDDAEAEKQAATQKIASQKAADEDIKKKKKAAEEEVGKLHPGIFLSAESPPWQIVFSAR